MKYFFLESNALNSKNNKNAGSKARIDADSILKKLGYSPIVLDSFFEVGEQSILVSLKEHINKFFYLKERLNVIKSGDELVIQFPMVNHSVFFFLLVRYLVKKGVGITLLIHDIELLRTALLDDVKLKRKLRLKLEELSVLKLVDKIIVHNSKMKKILCDKFNLSSGKLFELDVFDYLIPDEIEPNVPQKTLPIIIAGNLSPQKAGYISNLPFDVNFNLYGIGYKENNPSGNVFYKGSFLPDELILNLSGSFGLVWDGESAHTCSGVYGDYLRYNNSHKASLYLAAGYPIIVWKESALSDFVDKNQCGISINSLHELKQRIESISDEEYATLIKNANSLSLKLKNGFFLEKALTLDA